MVAQTPPVHVPDLLVDLLTTNVLGHVTSIGGDGSLATHIVWVNFDGEHILKSSPNSSYKGRNLRERPQVAISVVDPTNPWRFTGRGTKWPQGRSRG
jgi:hypothetical protein